MKISESKLKIKTVNYFRTGHQSSEAFLIVIRNFKNPAKFTIHCSPITVHLLSILSNFQVFYLHFQVRKCETSGTTKHNITKKRHYVLCCSILIPGDRLFFLFLYIIYRLLDIIYYHSINFGHFYY